MFDTNNINYAISNLYSQLFDGFFFFAAVIAMIISILITRSKYKRQQTLGKRRALKILSILLTVFNSIFLLIKIDIFGFLYNPYDYFVSEKFAFSNITDPIALAVYFTAYTLFIITIIVGIIVCVSGYKAVCKKEWTQNAYKSANILPQYKGIGKYCAICAHSIDSDGAACPRCGGTVFAVNGMESMPTMQTPNIPVQSGNICAICSAVNETDSAFCSQCGKPLK